MQKHPAREEILAIYDYDRERGELRSKVWSARRPLGSSAGFMKDNGCVVSVKTAKPTRLFLRKNIVWFLETGAWPTNRLTALNGDIYDDRFENLAELPAAGDVVTKEHILSLYHYDRDTGTFSRKVSLRGSMVGSGGSKTPQGYRMLKLGGRTIRCHQAVWFLETGKWPELGIDHINGKTDDNRFENLREVPHGENCKNRAMSKNNKSGVTGVHLTKQGMFVAYINSSPGKRKTLGTFNTLEKAKGARKLAEEKLGFHPNHGLTREERADTT